MINILGVMSGTSLDGIDYALCQFNIEDNKVKYCIIDTLYLPYTKLWKRKLSNAISLSTIEFLKLSNELGDLIGEQINNYIQNNHLKVDYVSSHGHTVFHQPSKKFTSQIGNGANIYAKTQIPVICDFRNVDIAHFGQGAPLVPIGDQDLFSDYTSCINLGGIANISVNDDEGKRVAFDICPINMALNDLSLELGYEYDEDGKLSKTGIVKPKLLSKLNELNYYKQNIPKSLGREWYEEEFIQHLRNCESTIENKMATCVEHMSIQISNAINNFQSHGKVLLTGGGTYNQTLIEKIREKLPTPIELIIPEKRLINFKEAIIFAYLGFLKINQKNNTLKSVTGANQDSIGGALYG